VFKLNVSVVIPCYNAIGTLKRSLDSVENQSEQPLEIIIVDDGSDEPIAPTVELWRASISIPITLICQSNSGAPAARNAGIKIAQGRYIAFLDADDIWLPNKLKIQYAIMQANNFTLTGHGYDFQASQLKAKQTQDHQDSSSVRVKTIKKWRFAYGNAFFTPTVMVLKEGFSGFDNRFRRVDDYKAWVTHFRFKRFAYIDKVLASGFKPAMGNSGLTENVDQMHRSYLDVLKSLLREGKINLAFYIVAVTIEVIKLPIRRRRYNS